MSTHMAADADDDHVPTPSDDEIDLRIINTIINTEKSAAEVERDVSRREEHLDLVDETLQHVREILEDL